MAHARVLDASGRELSPCSQAKALRLVSQGKATLLSEEPLTIRLLRAIPLVETPREAPPLQGKRLLLHICCAPCATYTTRRLREQGAQVTGYWYNPNIHPFSEHERRREALVTYAPTIELPMIWEAAYEMPEFLRRVAGRERFRQRCALCYRMRLERTAQVAASEGFELFTTTLLISPYQDQKLICEIGEGLAQDYGVSFYFENLRRGFAEHHRLAREAGLYQQRYCGCIYSEWEAQDRAAATNPRPV
ncbi:MAG: epoxyqueuosine reductase QueH [Chloroflexi bacterium]|nr:epoxyqueuosine reductase QueH [Chloroflexota bacterium]